jgi:predicted GTPase
VDTLFTLDGEPYVLVDTAGIRRKRAVEDETIELFIWRMHVEIYFIRRRNP